MNKQEFRDSLRMRYNLPLSDLPSYCPCGENVSVSHSLSCKKGGFVAQIHDGIRDLLTSVISNVCKSVESEPHLQPHDNERLKLITANTRPEARLDIKSSGFWSRGAWLRTRLSFEILRSAHFCVRGSRECHLGNGGMKERCCRIFN